MLKLSRLTDYAVVVLSRMGRDDLPLQSAPGIAARTGLAEPTVAKVLKILAQSEIVEGLRGRISADNRRDAEGRVLGARFILRLPKG